MAYGSGNTLVSISQLGFKEVLPLGSSPLFQNNWWWVDEYGFSKKQKNHESTHELFNMNHYRYEITKRSFNFAILVWIEPYGPCINMHILNMSIYCSHEIGLALPILCNNEKLLLNRDQQGVQSKVLLKKIILSYVCYIFDVCFFLQKMLPNFLYHKVENNNLVSKCFYSQEIWLIRNINYNI